MIIVISAPSGAGKTTLVKAFLEACPEVCVNVSHTTRLPRHGEQDGVDYHFVSEDVFKAKQKNGDFLESEWVFDRWYGSDRDAVKQLSEQQDVILEIDWQGARKVRQQLSSVWSLFILPPDVATLEKRLYQRGDDPALIAKRMQQAEDDMTYASEYDCVLINDDLEPTLASFIELYRAKKAEMYPK